MDANSQSDSTFDVTFAADFAVSENAPAATAPLVASPIPAARIDEAGLRAMARRMSEQNQGWAVDGSGPVQDERPIPTSPLELLLPTKSEPMVIPHPRRSA